MRIRNFALELRRNSLSENRTRENHNISWPCLINCYLFTTYFCQVSQTQSVSLLIVKASLSLYIYMYICIHVYIYIYILSCLVEKVDLIATWLNARIRILCVIAEEELTFRKRPSWKPQHLVTMSHNPIPFHYLFLPSLINHAFSLLIVNKISIYYHTMLKGWSRSLLICARPLGWAL